MPYNVKIQNEQYQPIPGTLYTWSGGGKVGEFDIPIGGTSIDDNAIEQADHFTVESPGYSYYGTSTIFDDTVFTLAAKPKTGLYVALAFVGGFVLSKLVNLRL